MQWYQIKIQLPLSLLESTYNFLWDYVNGLRVERTENGFLLESYVFSSFPDKLLNRLNNVLNMLARSFQVDFSPPVITPLNTFLKEVFIIVPFPTTCVPNFGIPILVQRGRAFGTGNHPCTIYCLQALKEIFDGKFGRRQLKRILDAGTGTGILAIAAARLGVKNIIGVEISPEAVKEAQENVKLNKVTKEITILSSSVTETKGQFDLIFANLYGVLLKKIAPTMVRLLAPKGWIVLGGMIIPDDELVISTFTPYGLRESVRYYDEQWSVAVLQKV
ncbi:MAG TPA: methyltransferase domain-containing protein [Candidatus Desulfofervidus auxilii]|uniref:Methyltransferase domain-containing protein n=1 Tax=Desulfofervidus auxilii TaxID=1621989 RepID=A0A7V1N2Q0_DESA2|nr:Ribosomal protein L11 methyltransferase [Candidatus Methanoperedenaceae archaeon GB37]HEB74211.1 methyltransferase domain-containing protein [Candidatus Desulfofervidus auxilii]HEC49691.1 methyltransferase domain-containing protein [Candidatus Desulfofervidus auxilii]